MTRRTIFIIAILMICFSITTNVCISQEQSLKKKDVPKEIIQAFQNSYPNANIKGYSKEKEQGKTVYEVESVEGKIHRDVTYNSDGILITIEESLPYNELPQPVRDAITKDYPKSKILTCEKVIRGSVTQFELTVKSGKQKHELVFNADGSLVKKEKK